MFGIQSWIHTTTLTGDSKRPPDKPPGKDKDADKKKKKAK